MRDREYDIRSQADKTCEWLFVHETFSEWLEQRSELLWIKGKPGAGKSTLLKYALRNIDNFEPPQNRLIVASYFFHGRGTEIQKTPLGLFRSVLHQIFAKAPEMLSELTQNFKTKLETKGNPGEDWRWHPMELQEILAASLLNLAKAYRVRIFVDALDECGEQAAVELVGYFERLISASRAAEGSLSICFSCRHYPVMALEGGLEICVEDENHNDIETYIQNELHHGIRDESRISILQQEIVSRATGSFQWVVLVLNQICDLHRRGRPLTVIQTHIRRIPSELNCLYRELLESIEEESISQSLQLMQWICFAIRPLTLDELRYAIAVDADTPYKSLSECRNASEYTDTPEELERRLKDLCRGLVETKQRWNGKVVQFVHQSVEDFLIQDGLRILDSSLESTDTVVGRAHLRLSRSCIRYIAMEEVGSWAKSRLSRTGDGVPHELDFLPYAVIYWLRHAEIAEAKGTPQSGILTSFEWPSNHILRRWKYIHDNGAMPFNWKGSLLHVASTYGISSVVEAILESAVGIDSNDNSGRTPLSWAAEKGHGAIVKLLLDKGANIDSKNKYFGRTPLSWAAEEGHKVVVELLLGKGADRDSADKSGQTPLLWAAKKGCEAIVKLLLENGANRDSNDNDGRTPLSWAAGNGRERVVKLLLWEGAKRDIRDNKGWTPLSWAAGYGHDAVVNLLLENEAERDLKTSSGQTPLLLAAKKGHEAVVKLLLENGAESDLVDSQGRTPLWWALANRHEVVVKLLLENGADRESVDEDGRTPLMWAAGHGNDAVVELLLEKGAKIDSVDNDGRTTLSWAAGWGHKEVVELLLKKGADVDFMDKNDRTALSWAAAMGREAVVELLLGAGAKRDSVDNTGRTPLLWTQLRGHEAIEKLLQ